MRTEVLENPRREKQSPEMETERTVCPIALLAIVLSFLSLIIEIMVLVIGR